MIAGRIRTLDVAKFALEAEIDDFTDVRRFEFLGVNFGVFIFRAVIVDGIEHRRKAAAKLNAHAAVSAQAENSLDFGTPVLFIIVSRVGRIVCWLMGQVYAPGSLIIFEATIIILSVTDNYARNSPP